MPLRTDIIGRPLPEQLIRVTPRMALAYAAAIGEDSAMCADDTRADFMAPPAFCVTPEWQVVIANRTGGLGLTAGEAVRGVHAGQNTRFLRPIRPGVTVRVSGEVVEVRATGAGALARTRLDCTDAESGEALVSTLTSALYRGVAVEGEGGALPGVVDVTEAAAPPAQGENVTLPLDRFFAHRYTECANIWNPIHTERAVALAAGLPDIIVHGTALWALAGRVLTARYAPNEPQRLTSLNGRFSAMVLAGDPITVVHAPGPRPGEIAFTIFNAQGREAVSRGLATFA
jgi:acyl dehydratase